MASSSPSSSLTSNSFPFFHSLPLLPLSQTLKPFRKTSKLVKAQTAGFAGSFYEGGLGSVDETDSPFKSVTMTAVEEFETPPCPPGFRQTMAVLRPDMSENGRLALTRSTRRCWDVDIRYCASTVWHGNFTTYKRCQYEGITRNNCDKCVEMYDQKYSYRQRI